MKTTAKLSLLAAAFLLVLAGCANNFSPTEPSQTAFKKNVENTNSETNKPLKVSGSIGDIQKYSDDNSYSVTVTFNHPVDLNSVKAAVKFYKLTAKDTDGNATVGSELGSEALIAGLDPANTTVVRFKINAKDTGVYAYITGAKLKAAGTDQKMDQDEDKKQGEDIDDDYGETFNLGAPAEDYGNASYLNKGAGNIMVTSILPAISFQRARKGENNGKEVDPQGGNLVTHITVENAKSGDKYTSETLHGVSNDEFGRLLKTYVVVEQPAAGEKTGWEKVGTSFTYVTEDGHDFNGHWVSAIAVKPETQLRVRFVGIRNIKVSSTYYKYPLKYTTDAYATDELAMRNLLKEENDSGKKVGFSAVLKSDTLVAKKAPNQTIEVTFTVPASFASAVFANDSARNVELMDKDSYIVGGYKGLDTSTLKKDNFKLKATGVNPTVTNTYTASKIYSDNGITATLSLTKDNNCGNGTAVLKDITALGNTGAHTSLNYYADVINKVTIAYDIVYPESGKWTAKDFYAALKASHERAEKESVDIYANDPLITSFYNTVKTNYPMHPDWRIKQFVHRVVGDAVKGGEASFAENGNVVNSPAPSPSGSLDLYVSRDVKTVAFKGKYHNGTEYVENYDIPSFGFGKPLPTSDDNFEREGWLKLRVN